MNLEQIIYKIAIYAPGFLLAIVLHEWAHGYVALKLGDDTAQREGRLTLNPVVHMDMFGTVIWPLICVFIGGFVFGYAKPVPVTPSRLKNVRRGIFWVSFAGPGMNIILGIVFSFLMALFVLYFDSSSVYYRPLTEMLQGAVMINFILAFFNLIPFPPLDGSKMVSSFLNYEQNRTYEGLQRYSLLFLALLWFSGLSAIIFYPAYFLGNSFPRLFLSMLG